MQFRVLANDNRLRRMLGADRAGRAYRQVLLRGAGHRADQRHHAAPRMRMLVVAGLRARELVPDLGQCLEHVANRHVLPVPLGADLRFDRRAHGLCHSLPSA